MLCLCFILDQPMLFLRIYNKFFKSNFLLFINGFLNFLKNLSVKFFCQGLETTDCDFVFISILWRVILDVTPFWFLLYLEKNVDAKKNTKKSKNEKILKLFKIF